MKITPKQYAVLVYEMTKGKEESAVKKIMRTFIELLARNRALSLLPRIERMYRDYYNVQEGVVDVKIASAKELGRRMVAEVKSVVAGLQPAQRSLKAAATVEISEQVDPSFIGGARIQVGDYMLDDTLKSRLTRLTRHLYGNR